MDAPETDARPHAHQFHSEWAMLVESHKTKLHTYSSRDAPTSHVNALDALARRWYDRVCASHNEEKGLGRLAEARRAARDFWESRIMKMQSADISIIDPKTQEASLARYYKFMAEAAADLAKFVDGVEDFYKSDVA